MLPTWSRLPKDSGLLGQLQHDFRTYLVSVHAVSADIDAPGVEQCRPRDRRLPAPPLTDWLRCVGRGDPSEFADCLYTLQRG